MSKIIGVSNISKFIGVSRFKLFSKLFGSYSIPDTYTKLLLHGDGTNGSTTFTDSSSSPKTVIPYGNVQISTAQSKFGGSSIHFDGNGDYLLIPDSDDWDFGTGDFTIDAFIQPIGYNTIGYRGNYNIMILSRDSVNQRVINFALTGTPSSITGLTFGLPGSSYVSASYSFSLNTWYHVAFSRQGDIGYLFINGNKVGQASFYGTSFSGNEPITVGYCAYVGYPYYFNGYINELRISKGIARWTSSFIPPSAPYSSTDYTLSYFTGNNGSLSGMAQQTVTLGSSGTTVIAIPNSGYQFSSWSDRSIQNPRTDTSILDNLSFTANFEEISDAYTKLLLHGNGVNGSTTFIDSSSSPKTVTPYGNVRISTIQSKFGGSSICFNGDAYSSLQTLTGTDLAFGTGNFTIDLWYRPTAKVMSYPMIIALQGLDGSWGGNSWCLNDRHNYYPTKFSIWAYNYNQSNPLLVSSTEVADGNWYHIAVVRSGNNFYFFINGNIESTNTFTGSFDGGVNYYLSIGGLSSSVQHGLSGYIDELRISKGIARWTSNFTPPTVPYGG